MRFDVTGHPGRPILRVKPLPRSYYATQALPLPLTRILTFTVIILYDTGSSLFSFDKMTMLGGKGGDLMCFTDDKKYIIKELNPWDHKTLTEERGAGAEASGSG